MRGIRQSVSRTFNQSFTYDSDARLMNHTLPTTLAVKRSYNARGYLASLGPT
jgi:hypothetical protein